MNTERPLIYVVILTWNQKDMTCECLDSVLKLDYPNFRVALVDNCSTDGTQEHIRRSYTSVELIENPSNLGYAGGNNVGIEYALANGAEYVFILNNDTDIHADCLTRLADTMEADPSIGVAGATIYYHCKPDTIWFNGAKLNHRTGEMEAYSFKTIDEGQFTEIVDSDYAPGCGMLVRSDAIRQCGGIDPRYFIYFEESDWCLHIKKQGYRIVIHPEAKVWHKISMAFGKETPTFLYYTVRNNLLFIRRNVLVRNRFGAYWRCAAKYMRQLRWLIGDEDPGKWTKTWAILSGFIDFMFRRFGRGTAGFLASRT